MTYPSNRPCGEVEYSLRCGTTHRDFVLIVTRVVARASIRIVVVVGSSVLRQHPLRSGLPRLAVLGSRVDVGVGVVIGVAVVVVAVLQRMPGNLSGPEIA